MLSGICDGFIGNRMLAAYRRQADYMLADGALPWEIDAAMREFGMPMGPYELQDLTGLQIAWANRKRQAATRDPTERYVTLGDQLCDRTALGNALARAGIVMKRGTASHLEDEIVGQMIADYRTDLGITARSFTQDDIRND